MPDEPPSAQLQRMINGFQVSQALHVAASLGVADLLGDGARTSDELAVEAGAHPRTLYRLLRALAAAGVFREEDGQVFSLTPLGEPLRRDHPASIAAWAVNIGQPYFWEAWGHLLDGVRTGENVFRGMHGTDVWSWRSTRPEENAVFNAAMGARARIAGAAVIAAYDFSRYATIVDVGGGNGTLLGAILRASSASRGIVFDQPHVVVEAPHVLREAGVADRCEAAAGSMFESVPPGADAYVMKNIVHDYEDEPAVEILRVCRAAMRSDSRLLVLEQLIGPPNEGIGEKFSDLLMFVMPAGQERTEQEFAALFERAGFRLAGVTRTTSPICVIEAEPA